MNALPRYRVRRSGAQLNLRHDDCGMLIARDVQLSLRELIRFAEIHDPLCPALAADFKDTP